MSSTPTFYPAEPRLTLAILMKELRPLIEETVEATIARLDHVRGCLPNKLCFPEAEAAGLIGFAPHQLRDERLRGRISASRLVGRRVFYLREDLVAYLMRNRINEGGSVSCDDD